MSHFSEMEILVVDDDLQVREALQSVFLKQEAVVTKAHDGSEALWNIKHKKFDVILTDVNVSKINGFQLISIAKTSKKNSKTPVFVITDQLDDKSVRKISKLGIASVIAKPIVENNILRMVQAKLLELANQNFYDPMVIKAFVAAVRDVLSFYLDQAPAIGKPFSKKQEDFKASVSGLIGFSSQVIMGSMAMSLDEKFLAKLIAQIFGPDAEDEINDDAFADVAGELCNQVLGKVRSNFGKLGIKIEMGLPEVIVGDGHKVMHKVNGLLLAVPVTVGEGTCVTEFTMTKGIGEYSGDMDFDSTEGNWLADKYTG